MSLSIIEHVKNGLKASNQLKQKISNAKGVMRLYPLAIPEGAEMPFVVIADATIEPESLTKDGGFDFDNDLVLVAIAARELGEATKIAQLCREALECYTAETDDYEVTSAWMEKATPTYNQDLRAYAWELTFGFESNDK